MSEVLSVEECCPLAIDEEGRVCGVSVSVRQREREEVEHSTWVGAD